MFTIVYAQGVADDLAGLRVFDRRRILDQIEEQLTFQPTEETRNKKILAGLIPPWVFHPPVRELRIDPFRVFYDVDLEISLVTVRAIRHKPSHQSTEEIL